MDFLRTMEGSFRSRAAELRRLTLRAVHRLCWQLPWTLRRYAARAANTATSDIRPISFPTYDGEERLFGCFGMHRANLSTTGHSSDDEPRLT